MAGRPELPGGIELPPRGNLSPDGLVPKQTIFILHREEAFLSKASQIIFEVMERVPTKSGVIGLQARSPDEKRGSPRAGVVALPKNSR